MSSRFPRSAACAAQALALVLVTVFLAAPARAIRELAIEQRPGRQLQQGGVGIHLPGYNCWGGWKMQTDLFRQGVFDVANIQFDWTFDPGENDVLMNCQRECNLCAECGGISIDYDGRNSRCHLKSGDARDNPRFYTSFAAFSCERIGYLATKRVEASVRGVRWCFGNVEVDGGDSLISETSEGNYRICQEKCDARSDCERSVWDYRSDICRLYGKANSALDFNWDPNAASPDFLSCFTESAQNSMISWMQGLHCWWNLYSEGGTQHRQLTGLSDSGCANQCLGDGGCQMFNYNGRGGVCTMFSMAYGATPVAKGPSAATGPASDFADRITCHRISIHRGGYTDVTARYPQGGACSSSGGGSPPYGQPPTAAPTGNSGGGGGGGGCADTGENCRLRASVAACNDPLRSALRRECRGTCKDLGVDLCGSSSGGSGPSPPGGDPPPGGGSCADDPATPCSQLASAAACRDSSRTDIATRCPLTCYNMGVRRHCSGGGGGGGGGSGGGSNPPPTPAPPSGGGGGGVGGGVSNCGLDTVDDCEMFFSNAAACADERRTFRISCAGTCALRGVDVCPGGNSGGDSSSPPSGGGGSGGSYNPPGSGPSPPDSPDAPDAPPSNPNPPPSSSGCEDDPQYSCGSLATEAACNDPARDDVKQRCAGTCAGYGVPCGGGSSSSAAASSAASSSAVGGSSPPQTPDTPDTLPATPPDCDDEDGFACAQLANEAACRDTVRSDQLYRRCAATCFSLGVTDACDRIASDSSTCKTCDESASSGAVCCHDNNDCRQECVNDTAYHVCNLSTRECVVFSGI